jgi:arylsulfatase A-like enzyme
VDARLSRRRLLQAGAASAAGAALLPAAGCSSNAAGLGDGRLNVLVLIIDSLRPDHVGAYGSPQIQTPNVDALAARGLRFNRAFPEAMVTIPARRSIFTSRRIFPYRHWKPNLELGTSPGWLPIEGDQNTFTKTLQSKGYWAVQVSDNPHLAFTKAYEGFRKTYDEWRTIVGQAGYYRPPETVSMELVDKWLPTFLRDDRYIPGMRKYLANTGRGENEEETCAARVYKDAADTLEKAQRRQPFAMVVDCFDPHEPWSPPENYIDLYSNAGPDVQNIGVTKYGFAENFTPELLRRLHAIYAGEVTMTDHWLGHFMDRFYDLGLDENTVIVMLSDHGYLLGERGYTGKVPSQLHPELAQVPMILVTPDNKAAGKTAEFFASTHDVGPTVLSMLGLDPPQWMEGTDLSRLMDGEQPPEKREVHYGGMYNRFFIRTDDYVLIGDNRGNERTLYDLRQDPHEFFDIEKKNRKLSEELYQHVLELAGGPLPYYE